jgi:hypothetical protein
MLDCTESSARIVIVVLSCDEFNRDFDRKGCSAELDSSATAKPATKRSNHEKASKNTALHWSEYGRSYDD